ncbi:hypothetical protein HYPSUDRAFT_196967 [Hypholoma sublateritium FD-334 SS-4]|uniref:Carboxylic ester hydrolase n=1 Tax=Hypholoma sublateritium (strain FD-334 SS-4) TaxID=945553 RepID=A0A0D2QAX3_HYPSF|nr:hypothetical protein HYPSUDRAFT_196967 [Hypholoma sublateritium FD-334 SS-4]
MKQQILSILSLILGPSHVAQDPGLLVATGQGAVAGTLIVPTVRQFLGIPYGTAKRWQPAQIPPVRHNVFQATKYADGCLQNLAPANSKYLILNGNGGTDVPSSEDCLAVNIWAPSKDRKQNTAVLIWIHGGGFVFGTSGIPAFEGTNMVRDNDDITLVTINYRLNIFGQPNPPQYSEKINVNFGLLDVHAAIHWVHANIANFGGDPNRITIAGQSAGGTAVDAYTFAHPNDTIVKGVIEQSGRQAFIVFCGICDHTDWTRVASAVGCGGDGTLQQMTCMRTIAAPILEQAVMSTGASFNLVLDNVTIHEDFQARADKGNLLRVPLLVGSTAHEEDIFLVARQLSTTGLIIPALTEIYSDASSGFIGTCPSSATAAQRLNMGVPTFRYQYEGVFRSLSTRPDLRAYHSAEIPMIFGTYNSTVIDGGVPASAEQIALSKYMQSAWVAFARDPVGGLPSVGWPLYNPNTSTLAQLGNFFNTSGVVFEESAVVDAVCNHQGVLAEIIFQSSQVLDG